MHATMRRIRAALTVPWLFSVGLISAAAQGTGAGNPNHATFYTEPNFRGEALQVEAGASVTDLARLTRANQQPWLGAISSVRLAGDATVTVFSRAGRSGERLEIGRDIPDLYAEPRGNEGGNWDRAIAALQVAGSVPSATSTAARDVTPPAPPSMRAAPAPVEGQPQVIVVQTPPPPPIVVAPPRPRMDRRTAEAIVDRAYREVLDRPADPEGMRRYRDRVLAEGWSDRQLIEHLQRSPEARAINADTAIARMLPALIAARLPAIRSNMKCSSPCISSWIAGAVPL